jgi:hypothetical protein
VAALESPSGVHGLLQSSDGGVSGVLRLLLLASDGDTDEGLGVMLEAEAEEMLPRPYEEVESLDGEVYVLLP